MNKKMKMLAVLPLLSTPLYAGAVETSTLLNDSAKVDTTKSKMTTEVHTLDGFVVTAIRHQDKEKQMIKLAKNSPVTVSNISTQEIQRTQDSNAGEVIRRIPGVSIIEEKFVMVRGLAQRYNNVWINDGAVPSSEADTRAFSFDIIPSSQIDNMQIIKTPAPDFPADYSGGFIEIYTKEIPARNTFEISLGTSWNSANKFDKFSKINMNNWYVKNSHPFPDIKPSLNIGHKWTIGENLLGMILSMNYTNEYRTKSDMQNNLYGAFDKVTNNPVFMHQYTDQQYAQNGRLGAMLNFTLLSPSGINKYQFKNIFNNLTTLRYTLREGYGPQSDRERAAEYFHKTRTTYNGQFTGKHSLPKDEICWSAGYAFANRRVPDRRKYMVNDRAGLTENGQVTYSWYSSNDVTREWTWLNEHIFSVNAYDKHQFDFKNWKPTLKYGLYGEYRTRKYTTKYKFYNWDPSNNTLPENFQTMDMPTLLSDPQYQGEDKIYSTEQLQMRNNYKGHNSLGAGFVSADLPFGKLSVYAGLRYEYNKMVLESNTSDTKESYRPMSYASGDFFPSINTVYKFDKKNQLRLSYGRSINRAEFREVSPSVFYDFDLVSDVQGNTNLKNCYVNNLDLRFEWYPSQGEVISLAGFYKHFDSPIEWTYTVAGGTNLIYSFKNAKSAHNYGIELDLRKDLSFIGLKNFSLSVNGAIIDSHVEFSKDDLEENRPMQGQSPYLINAGLFYKNPKHLLDMSLLYNRIGKRIIGVGRSEGSEDKTSHVPDSYEMPRNSIDFNVRKRFGSHWEAKLIIRDLLAENVTFQQFDKDSNDKEVKEITKKYRPGRNIGINVTYKF